LLSYKNNEYIRIEYLTNIIKVYMPLLVMIKEMLENISEHI